MDAAAALRQAGALPSKPAPMPFRFVHTADLHLDSPLRSLALRDPALADMIGDATRRALSAIVDLCLDEQVDALVVAGDLYDGAQTSMKTARFLAGQMDRLREAGISVFIARGNHDAESRITRELDMPGAHVFGGRGEAIERRIGGLDVAIHGLSFARPHAPESLLPKFRRPAPDAFNLGVMHTSLAGAPGHDVYAPCALADLHGWGFDYWALGHIHARTRHEGPRAVVMPGMPQGRDINESGPKSVTLVTVRDDRSVAIEERTTSLAQFERVRVDLAGVADWRGALSRIEQALGAARDRATSEHLVARLSIAGATPLAFRLRRDRDLLREEAERRAEAVGKTWLDRVALDLPAYAEPTREDGADPLAELGALMREGAREDEGLRADLRALVEELSDDLPPEARGFTGDDEGGLDAFLDKLAAEGAEEALARLAARAAQEG